MYPKSNLSIGLDPSCVSSTPIGLAFSYPGITFIVTGLEPILWSCSESGEHDVVVG